MTGNKVRMMSRSEFFERMNKVPNSMTTRLPASKAQWNYIYTELRKTEVPLTTAQIWKVYVKQIVTRHRTKNKLHEWAEKDACIRLKKNGMYHWYFGPIPEGVEFEYTDPYKEE